MAGSYQGCQVEAAVSSHTPLPTSLTISEPYPVLTKIVTGWELTLKRDGNGLVERRYGDIAESVQFIHFQGISGKGVI